MAGRWTDSHHEFLLGLECDVLLLTEVSERLRLDGYAVHMSEQSMADRRRWAAVLSRTELTPRPDPHPASAVATIAGTTYCSSILPWRSCGRQHLLRALEELDLAAPTALLPHRIDGLLTIDHVAVARAAIVVGATRFVAETEGRRLSDHDAYVVEIHR